MLDTSGTPYIQEKGWGRGEERAKSNLPSRTTLFIQNRPHSLSCDVIESIGAFTILRARARNRRSREE